MRPSTTIEGVGTLREITLWKAFVFGILTFGIYYLVLVYQNSTDLHAAAGRDNTLLVVLFVVGIFVTPVLLVLFAFNGVALNDIRQKRGRPPDATWIVALVLNILPIVGSVVWAVHFNAELARLAAPAS